MFEKFGDEKILVTGGSGFLGSHTIQRLVSEGFAPVVLTRNLRAQVFKNLKGKINPVKIDLLDAPAVEALVKELRPDRIVHLAGSVYQTGGRADDFEKTNYAATVRLLDAARRAKVKRFILTGTADEYGFQSAPQTEAMRAMPQSDYAVSKNRAVEYALNSFEKYNLPAVVARPFTIYGDGQPSRMFVAQAVDCAVRRVSFEMSRGEQKRDLLFVTDFVDAIIKLLTAKGVEGEIFNVGSGEAVALKTIAEKIWKVAGADERLLKIGARATGASELYDTQADISKIKRRLGWQPQISLDKGLKTVVEKAKKNYDER